MPGDGHTRSGADATPLQLAVRDTALDGGARRAGCQVTREEAVIGVLGAGERKAAAPTFAQAAQDGIPLLALDDVAPGALSTTFQLIHAPEARVAKLARRSEAGRATRHAGARQRLGKRLRDAFRREVTAGADTSPPRRPTSQARRRSGAHRVAQEGVGPGRLRDRRRRRLELVAPALAFADLWSAPWEQGVPRPSPAAARANVLLLSTARPSPRLRRTPGATSGRAAG
jgi:hypothetical protein